MHQRTEKVLTLVYIEMVGRPVAQEASRPTIQTQESSMKIALIATLLAVTALSACKKTEKTTTLTPAATPTVIEKTV